jgi:RNA polymerase sigma-70 factor (ECF subfamily)
VGGGTDDLLAALRAGNHDALRRVAQQELEGLYVIASGILGNTQDAEDACQETLIRLHKSARRLRPDTSLRSWLRTVCVNWCRDELRRRRNRVRVDGNCDRADLQSSGVAPEEVAVGTAFELAVMQAVTQLSPQQREVFLLRHFQNCSVRETAEILGCSQGTVKSQFSRALCKLRELLSDWNPEHSGGASE